MLDSIILDSTGSIELTTQGVLICTGVSIALGLVISAVYMFCNKRYTKDYVITLVILPILVQTVIMMVNGNLGIGVAVMGAFSLVRFRSVPGSAREIGIIFFAMAAGLATGMGFVAFAGIITLIVSLVLIVLSFTNYGTAKYAMKQLKITIPEDLDYSEIFDEVFDRYTSQVELVNVKTTNLGSLFTLTYEIVMKGSANEKEMIDDLRCRNGNLTISLARGTANLEL